MTVVSSRQFIVKALIASGFFIALLACMTVLADRVSAHGYVDSPGSRSILCKQGLNTDCGNIIYEPQSLETLKGFPAAGPADGQIASAGGLYPKLDEQSSTRWSKVAMTGGQQTFTWKFTANHATSKFHYYITKTNWDPNAPLTRNQFDLTPFCTVNYGGVQPPMTYSHNCNVPTDRTGYHVILAVWDVSNTVNAFYNAIDVNFPSGPADTQAPTAPTSLSASNVGSTTATLAWSAATDNNAVASYKIYNGTTLLATVPASPTNRALTGLTSSTSYSFRVTAVDAAGNESAASNIVNVTTTAVAVDTAAPSAPPGLHIMNTPTSTSVWLMWSASTDNVGVTGYRIYRGTTLLATVSGSTLDYVVNGLTPSTAYAFSVRAIDAAGNQSAASNVNATTAAAPTQPAWAAGVAYTTGTKVTYNGVVYECRQNHTSIAGWEPANVASLWKVV
ncbi:lytic polysaccharide monooxygenase [Paenibacillus sp. GSMTC-2017]|uniref:lytic polysaccharide monooxygenase n=1 Tax=Paenibacillus sp. GSMTC-2017 TaxID=2794350 RepID=UPI0018D605BF|nr:lytic polysaccharide monooxygenase [Paenibacillus sp. GSMTC-2017]MBH5317873.1 lytic polysaccharide monooxygenase [Paenibacillus sp. GSMTC-2017]